MNSVATETCSCVSNCSQSATSMASFLLNHHPKIRSSTCAAFTLVLDILGQLVLSPWPSVQQLLNSLHHCLTCCYSLHHHTPISVGSEFRWENQVATMTTAWRYKFIHRTNFPMSLPSQINMTGSSAVYCTYLLQVLPPTKSYRLGSVQFIWLFL